MIMYAKTKVMNIYQVFIEAGKEKKQPSRVGLIGQWEERIVISCCTFKVLLAQYNDCIEDGIRTCGYQLQSLLLRRHL